MIKKNLLLFLFLLFSFSAIAGPDYQSGKIVNLTAGTYGIMIMMDSGAPENCEGTPYGWLLIKQEHTAIVSVVLAAWASGKKEGTVYTFGQKNSTGYCLVSQFDPVN
jgi:hypothetical protein